jgi:hypothetical protein
MRIASFALGLFLFLCTLSSFSIAGNSPHLPWSLEVGLGYGRYLDMYHNDGNTALARLGLAKEVYIYNAPRLITHFGAELGVQTGNNARPSVPANIIAQLGGLQIDSVIKPMIDLLLTARLYAPNYAYPVFGQIKLGAALRTWQFSRTTVSDITTVDPELQLGVGYDMSQLFRLSLSYQGVYGGRPSFNSNCPTCTTRIWGDIPTQNSVVLGISMLLDKEDK